MSPETRNRMNAIGMANLSKMRRAERATRDLGACGNVGTEEEPAPEGDWLFWLGVFAVACGLFSLIIWAWPTNSPLYQSRLGAEQSLLAGVQTNDFRFTSLSGARSNCGQPSAGCLCGAGVFFRS